MFRTFVFEIVGPSVAYIYSPSYMSVCATREGNERDDAASTALHIAQADTHSGLRDIAHQLCQECAKVQYDVDCNVLVLMVVHKSSVVYPCFGFEQLRRV